MTLEKIDRHDEILTDLRVIVARLDERTTTILYKLEDADRRRQALEERLEPIADSVTRWKGGLTMLMLAAGTIGAAVATVLKKLMGMEP